MTHLNMPHSQKTHSNTTNKDSNINTNMKFNMTQAKFQTFVNFCNDNGIQLLEPILQPNDLTGIKLTPQGQAVMEDKNCIVAAGAGSGKTTVLSFRFIRMVAQGISPERILTITFTKKATAEMKSRIYLLLQKAHKAGLVSDKDISKFAEVTISTVDSFCSEIVRSSAVHQGVPSNFRIQDDSELEELSNTIVHELLRKHHNEAIVQYLYSLFSVENLEAIFLDLARNFLNITKPIDIQNCQDTLQTLISNHIKELEMQRLNKAHARKQPSQDEIFYQNALEHIPLMHDYYELVSEYENTLFSRKREAGVLSFNDVMQLAIKILKEENSTRDYFKTKFDSVMIDEFQDNNDDYRKLLYLLCEIQYKDNEIRKTDHEGIPTLDSLSPCKIFLVGDEKQSIYKFRGADVSVFKRLSNEICQKPIELSKNWRSEPSIIHFCNHIFPTIMETAQNVDPNNLQETNIEVPSETSITVKSQYEASYRPLEARNASIEQSHITLLHPNLSEEILKEHKAIECEANVVSQFIEKICSKESTYLVPDDNDKTLLRPPYPNEIGLLLKVGSHQAVFEKALTAKSIPYTVSEARSLGLDSVANDFYSALQSCVYSYDKISFVSYLKSPFCSFTDKEIQEALALENSSNVSDISNTSDNSNNEKLEKLEKAKEKLKKLASILANGSICKTLDYMWYDMGYRAYMLSKPLNRPYLDHFDYLYAIAVDFDSKEKSSIEFLDYLRTLLGYNGNKTKEVTVFKESISGVQIMTVHKSKGLAFKIVIVADMHSGARKPGGFSPNNCKIGDNVFLSYEKSTDSKKTPQNPIKKILEPLEKSMDNAETKRILYVAATRAKYHLIFSGCISDKVSLTPEQDSNNSMLTYLLHSISYDPNNETNNIIEKNFMLEDLTLEPVFETIKNVNQTKEYYKNLFDLAHVQNLPAGIKSVAVTQLENFQDKNFKLTSSRKRLPGLDSDPIIARLNCNTHFGTLVHKIIENKIKKIEDSTENNIILEKILPQKSTEEEKEILLKDAKKLALSFINSSLYKKIQNMSLMSEKHFLLFDGSSFVEGAIDLLAIGKDEIYVIDFKTDLTCSPNDHKIQLSQYVKAVSSMKISTLNDTPSDTPNDTQNSTQNPNNPCSKKVRAFVLYLRDVENYIELN